MSKNRHNKIIVNKNYVCTNLYTTRIVEIFLELQKAQKVKNITEFCKSIGYSTSSWTLMSKGERGFPKKKHIENTLITNFNVNSKFLDMGQKPIFTTGSVDDNTYISYSFMDTPNNSLNDSVPSYNYNNNLPFISIQEQSNISRGLSSLNSISSSYNFYSQINSTNYTYEVSSDNMFPKLKYGDIILLELIDRKFWNNLEANNKIYVILHNNIFILKRIKSNNLKIDQTILLEDNLNSYFSVTLDHLQAIWQANFIIYSKL